MNQIVTVYVKNYFIFTHQAIPFFQRLTFTLPKFQFLLRIETGCFRIIYTLKQ